MRRTLLRLALFLLAGAAGWGTSELLVRTQAGRHLVARFFAPEGSIRVEQNLRNASRAENVADAAIDHDVALFRDQYEDEQHFNDALRGSKLSLGEMRNEVAEHLRARAWIEKQIRPQLSVNDQEVRPSYEANRARFRQPTRYRGNHLFIAAPDGSSPEVMTAKLSFIEGFSVRLLAGEKLPDLIAEASEDEATKSRGGDLSFFSAARMPPEFIDEIKKLQIGETSGPLRSHLGYHIVQLIETKPEREITYDEARPEIALALANERRALAVAALRERLSAPEFASH
ncbi:MAG: peptidylprolyl isomerase [Chthoniobacterales bacterium]